MNLQLITVTSNCAANLSGTYQITVEQLVPATPIDANDA
jgi:hypothetical protein